MTKAASGNDDGNWLFRQLEFARREIEKLPQWQKDRISAEWGHPVHYVIERRGGKRLVLWRVTFGDRFARIATFAGEDAATMFARDMGIKLTWVKGVKAVA